MSCRTALLNGPICFKNHTSILLCFKPCITNLLLDFKPEMTIPDIGFHLFPIHILLDLLGKTQTQPNVAGQLTKRYTGEVWEQIPICYNICNNLMIFLKGTITNSITTLKKITLNCNVPFSYIMAKGRKGTRIKNKTK